MDMLRMCVKQGYVPPDCKLDGMMVWLLVQDGKTPCQGCNADCVHKKTQHTECERTEKEQERLNRIKKRESLGTNSNPIVYVDAGIHDTTITAILPNSERGYVKHCKESVEEAVIYIEVMCRKYNANQVIICTNGFGIAIYDYLVSRKLDLYHSNVYQNVLDRKENGSDNKMKVFLGGTCAGWKWRDELQPLLKCDYYNPIVKNWSEEDRLREVHERETSDYVLYGITNGIKGVYSIAEVVDDSNKRPEKTIFLNLYKTYERSGESKQMAHSLKAVENMLKANGAVVFSGENALLEVAKYLNTVEG